MCVCVHIFIYTMWGVWPRGIGRLSVVVGAVVPAAECRLRLCPRCPGGGMPLLGVNISSSSWQLLPCVSLVAASLSPVRSPQFSSRPLCLSLQYAPLAGHQPPPQPLPSMYFWNRPPVFHLYLVSPACISPSPWYPAVSLCLAIMQRIHCISHCSQLYAYLSSCVQLYLLYPAVSHRISPPRKREIQPKTHSRLQGGASPRRVGLRRGTFP